MIALLALGCTPPLSLGPASPAVWVEDGSPITLDVLGAAGDVSADAWVRARNGVGASVNGGPQVLQVDGVPFDLVVGSEGYATFPVTTPGTHELRAGGATASLWIYGRTWPGFGLPRGLAAPMTGSTLDAVPAGRGVLTAEGVRVWWTGAEGRSHEVLHTETNVDGMVAGHLDGDGLLDAVVWAGRSVHVLRGGVGGGMIDGGHLRSATHDAAAVAIGDASGDGLADLAITWVGGPSAGRLDIWEGDGLLGFDPMPNRVLELRPFGVAIGDNRDDGTPDVTIAELGGNWMRFYRGPGYYAPMGPTLDITLPQSSLAYAPRDLNADEADELLFVSPWADDAPREIRLFDMNEEVVTIATLDRESAHLALVDLDGDGRDELLTHAEDGTLALIRSSDAGNGLSTSVLAQTASRGPVAVPPGERSVLVAGDPYWLWLDVYDTPDGPTAEEPDLRSPGLTIPAGVFELAELDGNAATTEVIALRGGAGSTRLRVWSVDVTGVVDRGEVELDPAEKVIIDLARCDDEVWVLLIDGLHRVSLADPDAPTLIASSGITGRKVACGPGPAGPAAVLQDDEVALLSATLEQVGVSPASGSENVLLDAAGTSTCDRPGCDLARGAVGPDGAVVDVVGWPSGSEVGDEVLPAVGLPTLADLDGNGALDLVLHHQGRLVVHRHTGDGLGPASVYYTRRPLTGRLQLADYDGDGLLDAWGIDPDSDRLQITPALVAPPAGDAGLPDTGGP